MAVVGAGPAVKPVAAGLRACRIEQEAETARRDARGYVGMKDARGY